MNRCIWTGKSQANKKPWGYEIEWNGIFHGKEIHLKASHRTSLKFHKGKEEVLYIQHGEIEAEIADECVSGQLFDPLGHGLYYKIKVTWRV